MKKYNFYAGPSILSEYTINNTAEAIKNFAGTGLSILEISDYVGYESVSYFNRLFAKQVGMAPRVYRKSVRNSV